MNVEKNNSEKICIYVCSDRQKCQRDARYGTQYCIFHLSHVTDKYEDLEKFSEELDKLIIKKDGNWFGFVFPNNFKIASKKIDFPIDLYMAKFNAVSISEVDFMGKIDFSYSEFGDSFVLEKCNFSDDVECVEAVFKGKVFFKGNTVFMSKANFYFSQFFNRVSIRCQFKGLTTLSNVIFYDSVEFYGSRNVFVSPRPATMKLSTGITETISYNRAGEVVDNPSVNYKSQSMILVFKFFKTIKLVGVKIQEKLKAVTKTSSNALKSGTQKLKDQFTRYRRIIKEESDDEIRRIFESDVNMLNVEFRCPERTVFYLVDFSRMHLVGTNFRGVNLHNIKWAINESRRKVIFDEIYMNNTEDIGYKITMRPRVEEAYRNLRLVLEDIKDYSTASDFYVGEMEAKRRQKPFIQRYLLSVEAWYKYLSQYGTGVLKALSILIIMIMLHASITAFFTRNHDLALQVLKFSSPTNNLLYFIKVICAYFINAVRVLSLQRTDSLIMVGEYQSVLDTLFRILGPIQIALLSLAMRSKVKRH